MQHFSLKSTGLNTIRRSLVQGAALGLAAAPLASWAQFRVEISGVGVTQLPIAVAAFKGEDTASQKIGAIVLGSSNRSMLQAPCSMKHLGPR
jgi:TolB protein